MRLSLSLFILISIFALITYDGSVSSLRTLPYPVETMFFFHTHTHGGKSPKPNPNQNGMNHGHRAYGIEEAQDDSASVRPRRRINWRYLMNQLNGHKSVALSPLKGTSLRGSSETHSMMRWNAPIHSRRGSTVGHASGMGSINAQLTGWCARSLRWEASSDDDGSFPFCVCVCVCHCGMLCV